MSSPTAKPLARRQVLGAGVAGAALLAVHEGCSSGSDGATDAAVDGAKDSGGGTCPAADYTRTIDLKEVGLDSPGTSYEFTDACYLDPACMDGRIIVIHPMTKDIFVALAGACPHMCCDNTEGLGGPTYYPMFNFTGGAYQPFLKDAGPKKDSGARDAESRDAKSKDVSTGSEGGKEGGAGDGGKPKDAGIEDAGGDGGMVLDDVLVCTCHGSAFSAIDGSLIRGPASTGLQKLKTAQGEGGAEFLDITIPM